MPKIKDQDRFISHGKAAKIAGVSRPAITQMKSTRSFFTPDNKVDILHLDWKSYIKEKQAATKKQDFKNEIRSAEKDPANFAWLDARPTTILEEKTFAEIVQKKIGIAESMGVLIERKIVLSALSELKKAIQTNFVDHGRRVSPLISAKLGLPGTEKSIEKIENEQMARNIENTIRTIEKVISKL